MGLIERVVKQRERQRAAQLSHPAGRVLVDPFERHRGHDDSLYVPEEYANYLLTSAEVFAAASLRARLASRVPLRCYRGRNEDKQEMPRSSPALLLDYVNPFWTPRRLARMDELSMCIFGETHWAIHKVNGVPKEIWWLKSSRMSPVVDAEDYISGWIYESNVDGSLIPFRADEIVWQRYPNPHDEFSALSPISAARLAADTASAMMKSNRNLHRKGVQIAGMVVPKGDRIRFTSDQAKQLQDDLEARFEGVDNAHRWTVLRYEAEFKPVSMSPKDAEWVNGMGMTLRQICNAFGIPSPLLNDLEHATLANLREFQKALWEHALVPDLELRAEEVEEQLLPMFPRERNIPDHVEADFSKIGALQEAESATWDRDRQAIDVGALTINEWRKKRGMPAVAWGDVYWAPANKAPMKDAKALPAAKPAAKEPAEDEPVDADVVEDQADVGKPTEQAWARVLAALEMDLAGQGGP